MAETNTSEDNKYIKCSKCRLKYKNEDKHKAHDFGYNRLGEQFKTCFICRDKQKKRRENSKKEDKQNSDGITDEHYDEIDKELRSKYEDEFKIKPQDKNTLFYRKRANR